MLITGSSGMLGSNIADEIGNKHEITGIYKSTPNPYLRKQYRLDLTDIDRLSATLKSIHPDCVIHCAALTDVELCEQNYDLAYLNNSLAVKNLLSVLPSGTRFIYISTDSVFDGNNGNYAETDEPRPINNYSKTKLEGERITQETASNYVIVRTNIFGWNLIQGVSFLEWIFGNLSKNIPIFMFTDVTFSPISVYSLSFLIERLINNDFIGKLHIGTDSFINKYDFGVKVADIFGFDKALISPVSIDTSQFRAKRPKNTTLNVSKAKDLLGNLPEIDKEIELIFKKKQLIHN